MLSRVVTAATSSEQVPSPQGREGCSHSSAGHAVRGPALCTQLPALEKGLRGEQEQELFRSSLRYFLHSLCAQHSQVCTPELAAALQRKAQSALRQSWKDHSCPFSLLWPPKLLSTFPQCFFHCWFQAVIAISNLGKAQSTGSHSQCNSHSCLSEIKNCSRHERTQQLMHPIFQRPALLGRWIWMRAVEGWSLTLALLPTTASKVSARLPELSSAAFQAVLETQGFVLLQKMCHAPGWKSGHRAGTEPW